MSSPQSEDEQPADPAQAHFMSRVRLLMAVSGFATFLGIAVVLGVIGYRVFRSEGRSVAADVTALIPKGAKIVQTAVAGDRLVVTIETGGAIEIRTFDVQTLRPAGRLKFAAEP
ncbi:MAG: hypothetical protein WA418_21680 [Bradyrhizobium sp.]